MNSQKHLSRQFTSEEKRMTSYPRTFSSRQSASFGPPWENLKSQETETEPHYLTARPFFVVNMPLDEKEQPLPLVPLRYKGMSWIKLKSYSLKVTDLKSLGRQEKMQERDWWRFLGSSWVLVYLNLTNQMHTQMRPLQSPGIKGDSISPASISMQVQPLNPWVHKALISPRKLQPNRKGMLANSWHPRCRSFWTFQT